METNNEVVKNHAGKDGYFDDNGRWHIGVKPNDMLDDLFGQMQYDEDRGLLPKGYTANAKKTMGVQA